MAIPQWVQGPSMALQEDRPVPATGWNVQGASQTPSGECLTADILPRGETWSQASPSELCCCGLVDGVIFLERAAEISTHPPGELQTCCPVSPEHTSSNATLEAMRDSSCLGNLDHPTGKPDVHLAGFFTRQKQLTVRVRCWCSHSNVLLGKMSVLLHLTH